MNDGRVREVKCPRPGKGTADSEYHTWLLSSVYPAVDALKEAGLIRAYGFLTHQELDLRLWLADGAGEGAVAEVLAEYGLPTSLEEYEPAETGSDREVLFDLLEGGAEQIRLLLTATAGTRSIEDVTHWTLNPWGFNNVDEARWHHQRAQMWYETVIRR